MTGDPGRVNTSSRRAGPGSRLTDAWLVGDPADWDGALPVALILSAASVAERRAALRRLAARVLDLGEADVEIAHEEGCAPRLVRPAASRLHLSSASRDGVAAVAVAAQPVGVDAERVDASGEVPWNLLRPEEAADLRGREGDDRARAFARLWTCKEALLKAIGTGLSREPDSVKLEVADHAAGVMHDVVGEPATVTCRTSWIERAEGLFVITIVSRTR